MARKYARIKGSVWLDEDWRLLTPQAQWAYFMLLSQPHITNCGVVPYLPVRWARLARGLTLHAIRVLLAELEEHRFVVVDEDAGEILIRSFVRHDDGVEKVPNVRQAALRQYEEIESRLIRHTLAGEYPHLFTYTGPDPSIHRAQLPLSEPLAERVDEPLAGGDNARGSFNLQRSTSSQQRARARPPDTAAEPELPAAAAAGSPNGEEENPLRAVLLAEPIAWRAWQITKGLADEHRCGAWIAEALDRHQAGEIENPGGWAWSNFSKNDAWPEEKITIAPGAVGARSTRKPTSDVCPDCGERQGHGHLETCPRMPQPAPDPEPPPDDDPEPPRDPEPEPPPPAPRNTRRPTERATTPAGRSAAAAREGEA